ncbi:MAG: hypothetical protein K2L13_03665 [Opitutales bacterium]|nr:hypothetical protein [Opitutales bacterium]
MSITPIRKERNSTDERYGILASLCAAIKNSGILEHLDDNSDGHKIEATLFDLIGKSCEVINMLFSMPIKLSSECYNLNPNIYDDDISSLMVTLVSRNVTPTYLPYVISNVRTKIPPKFYFQYRIFLLKNMWNKLKEIVFDVMRGATVLTEELTPSSRISHMMEFSDECSISVCEMLSNILEALGDLFHWQSLELTM